ncbi:serine hydrolase domain-containing protein [Kineococcus sp. SYSU DK006]|uniref:serine hydrolase domain-containing protein n=1 Tax=Kineococcus sp. SYSU DK006 TaxID=3383127 RepID=UPI003D7CCEF5
MTAGRGADERDPSHRSDLRARIAALIGQAGYGPDDAVVAGVQVGDAPATCVARGRTAEGIPVAAGTVVHTASLSKQVTSACVALLVRQGRLDVAADLARWMPELPTWAGGIRVRHLVHHTSGLPDVLDFHELERRGRDRTTGDVLRSLLEVDHLDSAPGTTFRYCNAGYVCLARVVERAGGRALADFADEQVFRPLRMLDSRFWSGPGRHPPGAAPTDPRSPAALSTGDGGLWSTAADLLRWNEALLGDELGISDLLHEPGRLEDGTPLDYAWGTGVRTRGGHLVHRHGGLWAGVSAQLLRSPGTRRSAVVLALDHDEDRTTALADALLDQHVLRA